MPLSIAYLDHVAAKAAPAQTDVFPLRGEKL